MPIIEFKNISFAYDSKNNVLEHISFDVNKGDYVGIIGPNGSGKSTMMKLMLGLLKPNEGTIKIFGKKRKNFAEHAKIGYVPQQTAYASTFPATVLEIIQSGRTSQMGLFQSFQKKDHNAVQKAIHITGLERVKNTLLEKLSGGQRQRTLIARALAGEPKVLVLDEPSTGVDIKSQETFFSFLKNLNKKLGITILLISHDLDVITNEADYVICVNKQLICNTPVKEFVKGDYMKKLYGENVKLVKHKHD